VAERPIVLPPEKGSTTVDHPVALKCVARTAECSRKSLELDNRLAAWDRSLMEMLSTSRGAIARSRQLLSEIRERDAK
jgi:hypothetical protein